MREPRPLDLELPGLERLAERRIDRAGPRLPIALAVARPFASPASSPPTNADCASIDDDEDVSDAIRRSCEAVCWIACACILLYYVSVLNLIAAALPITTSEQGAVIGAHQEGGLGQTGRGQPLYPAQSPPAPSRAVAAFPSVPADKSEPLPVEPVLNNWVTIEEADAATSVKPGTGKSFRDRATTALPCPACPEMVVVPRGSFLLGSASDEAWQDSWQKDLESPQVKIVIAKPFAVGRFAISFDEWAACVTDGACSTDPGDSGWGRANRPVINVSWSDAMEYVEWLSKKTGKSYRLMSEAEREYVARAGTTTPFWFGVTPSSKSANYAWDRTLPVNSLLPNAWGLYHVHGNVSEWTADCWNDNHSRHDGDAAPRLAGACNRRVVKGGSWFHSPIFIRSAFRGGLKSDLRDNLVGFRVARSLADNSKR